MEIHVHVRRLDCRASGGRPSKLCFGLRAFPFMKIWTSGAGEGLGERVWSGEGFQNVFVQKCVSECTHAWKTCLEASSEFREARIPSRWDCASPASLVLVAQLRHWNNGFTYPKLLGTLSMGEALALGTKASSFGDGRAVICRTACLRCGRATRKGWSFSPNPFLTLPAHQEHPCQ